MSRFRQSRRNSPMLFEMCPDLQRYSLRHEYGNRVSNLLVLRNTWPKKLVCIGEGLKTGGFAHRQRSFLIGEKHRSPMGVTLCHDSAGEAILPQPAVTFCMV